MTGEAAVSSGAKRRDYWWTVLFTDPISLPLVRLLARRRWLTPDQVSILALALGLAAGVIFALGTRTAFIVGGLTFYLAFIVDCVDGKLARALGTSSPRGASLDTVADGGRRAAASLGLAIGLWRGEGPGGDLLWAAVYIATAYCFLELSGVEKPSEKTTKEFDEQASSGITGRWTAAMARRRLLPTPGMPDIQAIVFILGPVTGLIVPALALGIALASAGILLNAYRRLR